jgi:magnesium transporter
MCGEILMEKNLVYKKTTLKILLNNWNNLTFPQRKNIFLKLDTLNQEIIWMNLPSNSQVELYNEIPIRIRPTFIQHLHPDDIAKLILNFKEDLQTILNNIEPSVLFKIKESIAFIQDKTKKERDMQFIRLNHDMTAKEAISHIKLQTESYSNSIYYAYVVDNNQKLLGIIPWKDLSEASADQPINELIKADFLTITILSRFLKKPTHH